MLEMLRQGANGIFAKILMGLLVLSFVGWGIATRQAGDMAGGSTLLTVGGQNVTVEQYTRLFGEQLRRLEVQANQAIPVQQAHQLGLDQQVFSQFLVDAHARDLNLGISDKSVLEKVAGDPLFKAPDGSFDRQAFGAALQRLGLSEAGYIQQVRGDLVRDQLLGSIDAAAPPPQALVDAIIQFQGEQRTLDYFVVPPSKAPAPVAPTDAKLKDYYELHKDQYRTPEYRVAGVLLASPDDIKGTQAVSDDEVKTAYDASKDALAQPERRHVQIMTFQDKPAAEKALAAIKTGKDFMAVSKDMGLADKDVDRGLIKQSDLLDGVAAAAAFKLAKDEVSGIVDGELATALIRVTEIIPKKAFDEVKASIKDDLARQKAIRALLDFRKSVEDARASGKQLKDLPAQFPFKYTELPAIDKDGNGIDGKPAAKLPGLANILKTVFASDVGVETNPVDLGKDGWAWVEVKEVKTSRQKNLDEVKPQVTGALQEADAAKALGDLAKDLSTRAGKGEDFAKLAGEGGGTVKTIADTTRFAQNPDLPQGAAQLAYSLAKGGSATVTAADGKSRIVFKVADIKPAKPVDEAARKALVGQIGQQLGKAISTQYIAGLETTYAFSLNQAEFNKIIGAGAGLGPGDQPE